MNPVSKSQATSNLIKNMERNKSIPDYFQHYRLLNLHIDSLQKKVKLRIKNQSKRNKRRLSMMQLEPALEIFMKRRRISRKISE